MLWPSRYLLPGSLFFLCAHTPFRHYCMRKGVPYPIVYGLLPNSKTKHPHLMIFLELCWCILCIIMAYVLNNKGICHAFRLHLCVVMHITMDARVYCSSVFLRFVFLHQLDDYIVCNTVLDYTGLPMFNELQQLTLGHRNQLK